MTRIQEKKIPVEPDRPKDLQEDGADAGDLLYAPPGAEEDPVDRAEADRAWYSVSSAAFLSGLASPGRQKTIWKKRADSSLFFLTAHNEDDLPATRVVARGKFEKRTPTKRDEIAKTKRRAKCGPAPHPSKGGPLCSKK